MSYDNDISRVPDWPSTDGNQVDYRLRVAFEDSWLHARGLTRGTLSARDVLQMDKAWHEQDGQQFRQQAREKRSA